MLGNLPNITQVCLNPEIMFTTQQFCSLCFPFSITFLKTKASGQISTEGCIPARALDLECQGHCSVNYLTFFLINLFITVYLFLVALDLRCCTQAFSSCGERGLLLVAVRGLLIAVASLVAEPRLQGTQASVVVAHRLSSCGLRALEHRFSGCGARAQLLRSMWDLPGPGLEPVSPALAGRFLTTAPPGKSLFDFLKCAFLGEPLQRED